MLFDLVEIRRQVRSNFNQEAQNSFALDTEIDQWVNEGYMKYAAKLMLAYEGQFDKTMFLDIVAGEEEITLPSVFNSSIRHQKTVLLERVLQNSRVPLQFHKRFDEPNITSGGGSGTAYLPTYHFRGSKLVLEPTPDFSEPNASGTAGLRLTCQSMPARLRSGYAQGGNTDRIILDAGADPRDDYYTGERIYIVDGRGEGQMGEITDYDGATRTAYVENGTFATTPDTTSLFSVLIHEDFPEMFHDLLPLYATKCAFSKERSRGMIVTFDSARLKELEALFKDYTEERTTARKFTQPWNLELQ